MNVDDLRARFPALGQTDAEGRPFLYLDGPGGTQTPRSVIDAIRGYLETDNSNLGDAFAPSRATVERVEATRACVADLLGAGTTREIVFGANMTTLTLAMSRALSRDWKKGESIVVTRLDHDANISPWLLAARDRDVEVRFWDFDPADCTLDTGQLQELVDDSTRLVAVGAASNAVGTINDVKTATRIAHQHGALSYVDAVHLAPHRAIDVGELDCDFLVCSPYKFFGPHSGVLYGKSRWLESLEAYKVRPAPNDPPGKWETGTQSFESLAGVKAAIEYIESLGEGSDRRTRLRSAFDAITEHEEGLALRFLSAAAEIDGLRIYGIVDQARVAERTPTFAIEMRGLDAGTVAARLGEESVFVWDGHYYAIEVMRRLGKLDQGGLVRVGFVHYNTPLEVDRLLQCLELLAVPASRTA